METKQLEEASEAYYAGNPIMTDAEFDSAITQLQENDPDNPFLKRIGAPVPGTLKATHAIPMGSLLNANNEDEFRAWIPDGQPTICLSHKMDGSSLELIYQNGSFVKAITRGDGKVGEDVTRNILKSGNIPISIYPSIVSVRCECLIHKDDWMQYFCGDANPRNSSAGTLRRHNGRNTQYLRFYAFDALFSSDNIDAKSEFDVLNMLSQWFNIPDYKRCHNVDNLIAWYKYQESQRDELHYEIDGIVAKIDNRIQSQMMGDRDGRPKGQVAIKFEPRGGETVLRKVVWQVGHTGALTPVGKVDPVGIGGTVIKRVTLCNMDEIERLGVAIGDTVEIIRACDVIPKLSRRIKKGIIRDDINSPLVCPACNCVPIRDGARIFCPNGKCEGQAFSRVVTWIRKRNILDIGSGLVVAAHIKSIQQLYEMSLDEWANSGIGNGKLGIKRATKVMESLEKSKSVTLHEFLGSLGIKGVGRSLSLDLCKNFSGLPDSQLTLLDIFSLTESQIARHEKFGAVRAADFCSWMRQHRDEVIALGNLMNFEYESNSSGGIFDGETICFTGKSPKPRPEMSSLAKAAGASVINSVGDNTTILVIADTSSTSAKAIKARKLGIKLMSPEDFLSHV